MPSFSEGRGRDKTNPDPGPFTNPGSGRLSIKVRWIRIEWSEVNYGEKYGSKKFYVYFTFYDILLGV